MSTQRRVSADPKVKVASNVLEQINKSMDADATEMWTGQYRWNLPNFSVTMSYIREGGV